MTYNQLRNFVDRIDHLPEDKRTGVRLLFTNPTDYHVPVFEMFAEWDGIDTLDQIIETAVVLQLDHAVLLETLFYNWGHPDDGTDAVDACPDDVEACPSCGNAPGEGITENCTDPNGCGFWRDLE